MIVVLFLRAFGVHRDGDGLRFADELVDFLDLGCIALDCALIVDLISLTILAQAGTGRDQLTDDNVLLQSQQMIYLALDGGLSQDLGGLLERGCGEEGLGGQRGLGDAHEDAGS